MQATLQWVFAYGSNMHLPDLRRWLEARGDRLAKPSLKDGR